MKLIRFLFRRRLTVKPVRAYSGPGNGQGWLVMPGNIFQDFIDDTRRYGLRVALWNVRETWRLEQ